MEGISPRYIQDKISNALVSDKGEGCINRSWCSTSSNPAAAPLPDQQRGDPQALPRSAHGREAGVRGRHKNEVQRAICADEDLISGCARTNRQREGLHPARAGAQQVTGQDEEPDERLMRSIEEKIDIPRTARRISAGDHELHRRARGGGEAVQLPHQRAAPQGAGAQDLRGPEGLDQLTSLVSSVVDKETQEKIDVVKSRLIKDTPTATLRHRRAELHRQHLRARRLEALSRCRSPRIAAGGSRLSSRSRRAGARRPLSRTDGPADRAGRNRSSRSSAARSRPTCASSCSRGS